MGINKLWNNGRGDYGFYSSNLIAIDYTVGLVFHNFFTDTTIRGHLHLYSFKFYNDNGSESTSTQYAAAIVEAADVLPGHKLRLRVGINSRLNSKPFTPRLMFRVRKANGQITPWATVEK